ncbi:protein serine threonine phosphatase 2C [Leucogyrophana mollusca]|uniref:Protein serine threonine phosphatase 2C n=1 Tax=Leucogyrophana mollusca TaxID=85980 RepID=A0ACB8BFP9_9AGAM|nr:protein serine threonine phosphatase 2C [Leucogyrophana mollusca]
MFRTTGRTLWSPQRLFKRTIVGFVLGSSGLLYCLHTTRTLHLDGQDTPLAPADGHPTSIKTLLSHPSDVNSRLRERERSHIAKDKTSGISRYDVSQISSNYPCEDDHGEIIVPTPSSQWAFFAIFDGHNGWETSRYLSKNLIPAIIGALADTYGKYLHDHDIDNTTSTPSPPPEAIDDTIKETFTRLDDDIVNTPLENVFSSSSREAATRLLAPAYSGSCAILGFYDSQTRLLRVALTGDSRAVLGRRVVNDGGKVTYDVRVLSRDQNGDNELEVSRLGALHPGESDLTKGNRVMGWGMSRAFGDAQMKWSLDVQARLKAGYLGRTPYRNVLTPPYFTAEPVITTTEIKSGDFLILASDGLWECLSNEEAVGLTGLWAVNQQSKEEQSDKAFTPKDLPVTLGTDTTERYAYWRADKKFTIIDPNAATHLIRNALGGADTDLTAALFNIKSPRSRSYMDDITAVVVFFDDD